MTTLLFVLSSTLLIFMFIGLLLLSLCIWAISDLFRNENFSGTARAIWVLIIAMFPIFGSLVYLLIARNRQKAA